MDMTIGEEGSLWHRLRSKQAMTSVSHIFVMEWAAVIRDIVIGLLIAGAVAAWVPDTFWRHFFAVDHPLLSKLWGPLIGPIVSLLSFVCSIGNVPLAGVLWNAGISFGGVISFIFADLIILPDPGHLQEVLRHPDDAVHPGQLLRDDGAAGYIVEILFTVLGLVPTERDAKVGEMAIHWNYTTVLNIVALLVAAGLGYRFVRTGGMPMLKMMGGEAPGARADGHSHG